MSFAIVQTRKKNHKPQLSIVPHSWLSMDGVLWPPQNWVTLSQNMNSCPDETWCYNSCKVVSKNLKSYNQAEFEMNKLMSITDSEDALQFSRGTRFNPGKKIVTFTSKKYNLKPVTHTVTSNEMIQSFNKENVNTSHLQTTRTMVRFFSK